MRLIAWNANYNMQQRSLEDTATLLEPLGADLLVLSETAAPRTGNPLNAHWVGDGKSGLAVVSLKGLNLNPHPTNAAFPPLLAAFRATGNVAFNLLSVWPVQRTGGSSYHEILMTALGRYADMLKSGRAIMAGDFNSNTRVSNQKDTHPQFVKAAESLGLVSVYHEQTGEAHGEEKIATYLHSSGNNKEFHIDYCFVPKSLINSVKLTILNDPQWAGHSDHFPIVLDVRDEAFSGTSV
jgi:exodeoxyribonuclease-3